MGRAFDLNNFDAVFFGCSHHQTTICTESRGVPILEGDANSLKAKVTYLVPTY